MRKIAELFGEPPQLFEWSGENTPQARHSAAVSLARLLSHSSPIHLVGFSHGGNIALSALAEASAETLITIATPVLPGFVLPAGVRRHIHVYRHGDLTQRAGGEWIRIPRLGSVGWAGRRYPEASGVRNLRIDAPAGKSLSGRHGDILWQEETWVSLRAILHSQDRS